MNNDWTKINRELHSISTLVKRTIKKNYKQFYKRLLIDKNLLSFLIFYAYWIHKKLSIKLKETVNLLNTNLIFTKYLSLIFNSIFNDISNISFLKNHFFNILKNNTLELAEAIYWLLKDLSIKIDKSNNAEFINLYLYFIILNNLAGIISSKVRDNLENISEYNKNLDIYLYSLKQFKKAKNLFEQIDRENLSDMTTVMNILSKNFLS